jgi:hypothetical protein
MVSYAPSATEQPAVLCPRCQLPMMRGAARPIMFTSGLSNVPYTCEACRTETLRTVKVDGSPHSGGIAGNG